MDNLVELIPLKALQAIRNQDGVERLVVERQVVTRDMLVHHHFKVGQVVVLAEEEEPHQQKEMGGQADQLPEVAVVVEPEEREEAETEPQALVVKVAEVVREITIQKRLAPVGLEGFQRLVAAVAARQQMDLIQVQEGLAVKASFAFTHGR